MSSVGFFADLRVRSAGNAGLRRPSRPREASLLRAADRHDEHDWFRSEAVEAALANAPHLSEEQAQAIRFSANRDGVAICEAPAGTGKTVLARALVDAARRSGLTVLGLSPTWVGADELSKSCGIEALAIAKWRHDYSAGQSQKIDSKTLIVIDEVGLAGVKDLEFALRVAREAHGKAVCIGDRRQLQAVSGGSALRAVADVVARGAVLSQVRRQEVGVAACGLDGDGKGRCRSRLACLCQE